MHEDYDFYGELDLRLWNGWDVRTYATGFLVMPASMASVCFTLLFYGDSSSCDFFKEFYAGITLTFQSSTKVLFCFLTCHFNI